MKKLSTLLAIILISTLTKATTLTLNNASPTAGQYVTWASALAAAVDGDTILMHGSLINYYTLNLNKRLTIIGPGHNPIDKQNQQKVFCDGVTFYTGSNRSTIIGIEVSNMQTAASNIDSVYILNCRINDAVYLYHGATNYWLIDGCVFTNSSFCIRAAGHSVGDLIVRNCIINGIVQQFNGTYIGYNYFYNNIFLGNTPYTFEYLNYFYFNNNIFYRSGFADFGNVGMVFNKNLSYQCLGGNAFPNGTNYENTDPMFMTNIGTGAHFDYSTDYHLQSNSPVLSGGTDGTELGVYGGVGDFDQFGIHHNPYIKIFNIIGSSSVNAGDSIQVYIKAKVRN